MAQRTPQEAEGWAAVVECPPGTQEALSHDHSGNSTPPNSVPTSRTASELPTVRV